MRGSRSLTPFAMAVVALMAVADTASAHRRDEYLQAARIAVESDRIDVALDLTPGIDVAASVMSDMDRDGDGALSAAEQQSYAARVAAAVSLDLDGRFLRVDTVAATFPTMTTFRRGEGTIELRLRAPMPALAEGRHQLAFRNGERRDVSVYLANALVPENDRVSITGQRRDPAQSALVIEFISATDAVGPPMSLLGGLAGVAALGALLVRSGSRARG